MDGATSYKYCTVEIMHCILFPVLKYNRTKYATFTPKIEIHTTVALKTPNVNRILITYSITFETYIFINTVQYKNLIIIR